MALSSQTTARPPRPTIELEVTRAAFLTPHLVRVTLGGAGFAQFQDRPETDKYVKLKFTASDGLPVTRTYTVRSVDAAAATLDIDSSCTATKGLAGPWAAAAAPGDRLSVMGPGGGYAPDATADRHLFVGDLSAAPAIGAALEALPVDATGHALLQIDAADAEMTLAAPSGVAVTWIVDPAHDTETLANALRALDWPDGRVQVFAHGERESMKAIRRVLFDERGLDRADVSLSGYWARGRTEDRFQAEKREPIGKIL